MHMIGNLLQWNHKNCSKSSDATSTMLCYWTCCWTCRLRRRRRDSASVAQMLHIVTKQCYNNNNYCSRYYSALPTNGPSKFMHLPRWTKRRTNILTAANDSAAPSKNRSIVLYFWRLGMILIS